MPSSKISYRSTHQGKLHTKMLRPRDDRLNRLFYVPPLPSVSPWVPSSATAREAVTCIDATRALAQASLFVAPQTSNDTIGVYTVLGAFGARLTDVRRVSDMCYDTLPRFLHLHVLTARYLELTRMPT